MLSGLHRWHLSTLTWIHPLTAPVPIAGDGGATKRTKETAWKKEVMEFKQMRENESKEDERRKGKKVGKKRWRELRERKGDELMAEERKGRMKEESWNSREHRWREGRGEWIMIAALAPLQKLAPAIQTNARKPSSCAWHHSVIRWNDTS